MPVEKNTSKQRVTAKGTRHSLSDAPASMRNGRGERVPHAAENAGDKVDEQLARYRSMRNFAITKEPSGKDLGHQKKTSTPSLPFVIQKHAATRLHYDFRLGWNGVLKSWAITKGPSYNVRDRRLAVEVEDHPMQYGGFEGIIPRDQYGGGTVMVWDQGTWEPRGNVEEGLKHGNFKFSLSGSKMHGTWALVRMGGNAAQKGKNNWLLIKEHDGFERPAGAPCITEEAPNSIVTGRTLEEIATAETHVWNSKETAGTGQAWYRQRAREADAAVRAGANKDTSVRQSTASDRLTKVESLLDELPKEPLPAFIKPQLATELEAPPQGKDWLHELKLDGYRIQVRKAQDRVQMLTRTGLDWTHRMKRVQTAISNIRADSAILDGEVVVLDEEGVSSFAQLQASFEKGEENFLVFYAFDLLHCNGRNTRQLPLSQRKQLLRQVIGVDTEDLRVSEHISGDGTPVFQKACELHAEGIISKKADAQYLSGLSSLWRKSKCLHEQEFVIGGWNDLRNGTRGIGSLLLGCYDNQGKLIYAGKAGTGFSQKTHQTLRDRFDLLEQDAPHFSKIPTEAQRGAHWLKPQMVAQIRFATWTAENLLRQAAFLGLREDKPAADVRKEEAAPQPKHTGASFKSITKQSDSKPSRRTTSSPLAIAPTIRLTHPQKIVDASSGTTKEGLARYLNAVAEIMLPHITERPLSLVRCPDGIGKPCFYQKHVNHMLPSGIESVMVSDKKSGAPEPYITLNGTDALTSLAQMTVLEIHPWSSCNAHLEFPNRIIIDLDPDESLAWSQVAESAVEIRTRLKQLGLKSFVKTTGGKGLHIVFPVLPENDFSDVKAWAHRFVLDMERERPRLYLTKMTKAARVGKIYLDYLRNERGATAVAPYSMRARSGLPVSVPLEWKELESSEPPQFRIDNFEPEWKDRLKRDPWKTMKETHQSLPIPKNRSK